MEQTQIKTVELVRQIRDRHYEFLKDKSREEILHFFHSEAAKANVEARRLLQQEQSEDNTA